MTSLNKFRIALEEMIEEANTPAVAENKATAQEDEVVIYCKITDFDGLKQAISKEQHEQWEIRSDKGRMRVRKTIKDGLNPTYDITYKVKVPDSTISSNHESTFEITEEQFNTFKSIASIGMVKDRFNFNVNSVRIDTESGIRDVETHGLVYEVDVFKDEQGNYKEWCKIDLEVNKLLDDINTNNKDIKQFSLLIKTINLPFKPTDNIMDNKDPVIKKQIEKLYDDYFLTKK